MDPVVNLYMQMHVKLCCFFLQEVEQNFEKEETKEIEGIRGVYFQACIFSIEKLKFQSKVIK